MVDIKLKHAPRFVGVLILQAWKWGVGVGGRWAGGGGTDLTGMEWGGGGQGSTDLTGMGLGGGGRGRVMSSGLGRAWLQKGSPNWREI